MVIAASIVLWGTAVSSADQIQDLQDQVKILSAQQQELRAEVDELKAKLEATSAAAPTTMPTLVAKTNKRLGPWNVKVTNTIAPNTPLLKSQLASEQRALPGLEGNAERLRDKSTQMAAAKDRHWDTEIHNWVSTSPYDSNEIVQASTSASQAESDVQKCKLKIAKLQREVDAAENSWIAIGTLDDGSLIEIDGIGDVNKTLVQQMAPSGRYRVEGTSDISAGRLVVTMTQAVQLADAP